MSSSALDRERLLQILSCIFMRLNGTRLQGHEGKVRRKSQLKAAIQLRLFIYSIEGVEENLSMLNEWALGFSTELFIFNPLPSS